MKGHVMAKKQTVTEIQVVQVYHGLVSFHLLGTTPMIVRRMSEKASQELLSPRGRKTAADKAANLKHDPMAEFLASPYTDRDPKGPTLIQHLSSAFKKSIAGAALDVPGASKTQLSRLMWVMGERVSIYGIPQMLMSVVRSADMNKTPDIRTRLIIPKWACKIDVRFASPMLNETTITNLLVAGGMIQGVGDWRAEKGSGNYGSFEPVAEDNAEYAHIVKHGGRKAQEAAMVNPEPYDRETEELYQWFLKDVEARGKTELLSSHSNGNGKAKPKKRGGRLATV